jgi:hypothetical protein
MHSDRPGEHRDSSPAVLHEPWCLSHRDGPRDRPAGRDAAQRHRGCATGVLELVRELQTPQNPVREDVITDADESRDVLPWVVGETRGGSLSFRDPRRNQ